MVREERVIWFGGYNKRNGWVEGSACKNEFGNWLIIGPFMDEETDINQVSNVYQYTGIRLNGQEIFEGSRIVGGYQWMECDGTAESREIDDVVVWEKGSWVLESTGENLYELVNNSCLYWDGTEVKLPEEN